MTERARTAGWLAGIGAGLLLAASGALAGPAGFLLRRLPRRAGRYLLAGELVPLHARILGIYLGLGLAVICGLVLGYRHLRRRGGFAFLARGEGKFLFALVALLALLLLSLSVNRVLWDDEIEHVHASWYVLQGQVPYRDFFEHHHPLLWFLLAPLIAWLGEGLAVLAAGRMLMLAAALGIAWLTWRIARRAAGHAEAGLFAVAVLFSSFMFVPCVMEVRPDVPMVLLALAAVERLLVFLGEGRPGALLAAAFFAALSFLFLQKAVFLLPAAAALLCIRRWQGAIPSALFWKALAVFLLPQFIFAAWLILTGAFQDYFFCNWLLNVKRPGLYSLWLSVGRMALVNFAFWLSLPAACLRALRAHGSPAALKVVSWFGLSVLAAMVLLPNPADRHFLLTLPLLSVLVGAWAADRSRFPLSGRMRKIYLACLLLVPLPFLAASSFPMNGVQLEKIAYVLRLSAANEKVLDGRNEYNLFRPDVHYFWFQVDAGEMLDHYRRLRGGRHGDYDACRLIRGQKPRFILLRSREWANCDLWREYLLTPYEDLFIRRP